MANFIELIYELLENPPYSLDLTLSHYYSSETRKNSFVEISFHPMRSFFSFAKVHCNKCIGIEGDYIE